LVEKCVAEQRDLLLATQTKDKPSDIEIEKLNHPTRTAIESIQEFRDKHRTSRYFNHLNAIADGIPALGWPVIESGTYRFVEDLRKSFEFFGNKVLKEYKGKDQGHVDWVASFKEFMKDLEKYVKTYHPTGLSWSRVDAPPVKIPEVDLEAVRIKKDNSAPLLAGPLKDSPVISSHSKQGSLDRSLSSPKHKKRKSADDKSSIKREKGHRRRKSQFTKPAKCELTGNKWIVEYQISNQNITIEGKLKQTVYIYYCRDSVIKINGKINNITLDNCGRTEVIFESVLGACEVVNCKLVEVQCLNKASTVSIDSTTGCKVYLSKDSVDCDIITSKVSDINVIIPDDNNEQKELLLPQQFKTNVVNGRLVTKPRSTVQKPTT